MIDKKKSFHVLELMKEHKMGGRYYVDGTK